jgi:biotin carboxylase
MASDVAVLTLGAVTERLGLPGCSAAVARRFTNKAEFRAFQHASGGLSAPPFVAGRDFGDLYRRLRDVVPPPVVFKAVDSSGSRGVSVVETLSEAACQEAFLLAQHFSRSRTVCAEAFVAGDDVSGDGFLSGGRLRAVVTRKYSAGLVPLGHRVPTDLDPDTVRRVIAEVERTCVAGAYLDGPLDFDVRVSPSHVTVLEMSARLGGNGIPGLIERTSGVDLVGLAVSYALGEQVDVGRPFDLCGAAGSYVFGSARAGVLRSLVSGSELREAVPEVFEFELHRRPGEQVSRFEHGGHAIGHALFDCTTPATYESVVARIAGALRLDVKPETTGHARLATPQEAVR